MTAPMGPPDRLGGPAPGLRLGAVEDGEGGSGATQATSPDGAPGSLLGLRWVICGAHRPGSGREIQSDILRTALEASEGVEHKSITPETWSAVLLPALGAEDFVAAAGAHYRPDTWSPTGGGLRRRYAHWLDENEAWQCALQQPRPCRAHARTWWLTLGDFFRALNDNFEAWIAKLNRQRQALLAWQGEELLGQLGAAGAENARRGRLAPSARRRWGQTPQNERDIWLGLLRSAGAFRVPPPRATAVSWNVGPVGYNGSRDDIDALFLEGLPIICLQDLRLSSKAAAHLKADLQSRFPMYKVFTSTTVNDRTDITGRHYPFCVLTALHLGTFASATGERAPPGAQRVHRRTRSQLHPATAGRLLSLKAKLVSGEVVLVINLYQFTAGNSQGQQSILSAVSALTTRFQGQRIILMGDFNATCVTTPLPRGPEATPCCIGLTGEVEEGPDGGTAQAAPPASTTQASAGATDPVPSPSVCPPRRGYNGLATPLQTADARFSDFITTCGGQRQDCSDHTWRRGDRTSALDHAILWNLASDGAAIARPPAPDSGHDHSQLLVRADSSLIKPAPALPRGPPAGRIDPVSFGRFLHRWKARCKRVLRPPDRRAGDHGEETSDQSDSDPDSESDLDDDESSAAGPLSDISGDELYTRYSTQSQALRALALSIQEKARRALNRARERPPARSKTQKTWGSHLHLFQAALRESSTPTAGRISRATRKAMESLGVHDVTDAVIELIRAQPLWQEALKEQITRAKHKLAEIAVKQREVSNRQVLSKYRWIYDHAVKGMKRIMGRDSTQITLTQAEQRLPIGVSWNREPLAAEPAVSWLEEVRRLDGVQLKLSPVDLQLTTSDLAQVSLILEASKLDPPTGATSAPALVYASGPWSGNNLTCAAEAFFQRNAYGASAGCPNCQCKSPEPVTQVTPTGTRTPDAPTQVRTIRHFCPTCMDFTDFRHNRHQVESTEWMSRAGIFEHHTIPPGETIRGATTGRAFKRFLKRMASRKAPGHDGVPAELLKNAPRSFKRLVKELVDRVLTGEYVLGSEALRAQVVLLYKKADPKLFGNYRPIALLNSIYQLINIIITERAQKLTERHCVLQAGQYGFRWHRGVSMSAQRLHWLLKQARIKGGILIQINLDYRNAFNAAGHAQLWAVLEKLGVPDLDLIKAMYEQASMSITVEGKSSAQVKMDCGTAQGSTLSPLLFNLFINALLRLLEASGIGHGVIGVRDFNHLAFADDLSLLVECTADAEKLLSIVRDFEEWSGLAIASQKSFLTGMLFGPGDAARQSTGRTLARQRRSAISQGHALFDLLAYEELDRQGSEATISHTTPSNPHRTKCDSCGTLRLAHFFDSSTSARCLMCLQDWKPATVCYGPDPIPWVPGRKPTRFLGIHSNLLGDCSEQVSIIFEKTAELLEFLHSSPLGRRQNLLLIERTFQSTFRFSAGIVPWSQKQLGTLERMWLRAYKLAWGLGHCTASHLLTAAKEAGGLQVRRPLSVLTCTLWKHLENCVSSDDGLKELALLEYQEALRRYHCCDLDELKAEMALHTWDSTTDNRFAHACHLSALLDLRVHWDPFASDSIWMTPTDKLAQLMVDSKVSLSVPHVAGHEPAQLRCSSISLDPPGILMRPTSDMAPDSDEGRGQGRAGHRAEEGADPRDGRDGRPFVLLLSPPRGRPNAPTVREALTRNWPAAKSIPALLRAWHPASASVGPPPAAEANVAKKTLSWSRGTLHMRRQRRSLEAKESRTEHETRSLQALRTGEDAYHRLLPRLLADGFTSIDTLPRSTTTLNPAGDRITILALRIPVLRSGVDGWVSPADRVALEQWLNNRSTDDWSELDAEALSPPKAIDISPWLVEDSLSVSAPPLTNLQMAINHLLRGTDTDRPVAQAWWEDWKGAHTPSLPGHSAIDIAQIISRVDEALKLDTWHPSIQQIFNRLGPLGAGKPDSRRRRAPQLVGTGSVDPERLGRALIRRVLGSRTLQGPHRRRDRMEFLCEVDAAPPARIKALRETTQNEALAQILERGSDLLWLPSEWWPDMPRVRRQEFPDVPIGTMDRLDGWWTRGCARVLLHRCRSCKTLHTAATFSHGRCSRCTNEKRKVKPSIQPHSEWGVLMRTAEPELLESAETAADTAVSITRLRECLTAMSEKYLHEDTFDHSRNDDDDECGHKYPPNGFGLDRKKRIQADPSDWRKGWFTSASLGHPLLDDSFARPLHPRLAEYLDQYPTPSCPIASALREWHLLHPAADTDGARPEASTIESNRTWEQFSVPRSAGNPRSIPDKDVPGETKRNVLQVCKHAGVVRVLQKSLSHVSDETDTRVTVYENVASGIGPHGRFRIEGAKWQLLKTLSSPRFGTAFIPTLMSEIEWQLLAETRANHMSYTWPVLRAAQGLFKATSFQGGSMVSSPPFFDSAGRGQLTFWGTQSGPMVVCLADISEGELERLGERLRNCEDWVILTPPQKSASTHRTLLQNIGRRVLDTTGNASRHRGWWRTGDDRTASNGTQTEVWVARKLTADDEFANRLDTLRASIEEEGPKERRSIGCSEVEREYLRGSEAGLLGIWDDADLLVYAGDGSLGDGAMGAGVYCCSDGRLLSARIGRDEEGASSTRPETGAAWLALSDALGKPNPLVYLSDSEALLTNIDKWIGEGATPSMEAHQDEDIMRAIIDLLHARVASGFSTIFVKVKAHRGEPCNEMADRAADTGRGAEPIWSWPSNRVRYSWTSETDTGTTTHSAGWGTAVKRLIRQRDAGLCRSQPKGTNFTKAFLERRDASQDLLGEYLADSNVKEAATRRLLQSVSNQFPCNVTLFRNGLSPTPLCPQCTRSNPQSQQRESFGHIQCWCPTLAKPRTAAHHSIWRELLASIKFNSNITRAPSPAQTSDSTAEVGPTAAPRPAKTAQWEFPTVVTSTMVKEWTIKDIVCHIAADPESVLQIDEIDDKTDGFLRAQGLNPSAQDVADFLKKRPDGVAFRRPVGAQKQLRILEFTRASDTSDDWQEKKEVEKNLRYCQHVKFISELTSWHVEQINFTVGIRGQLQSTSFKRRLLSLGVETDKAQESIRKLTVRRTLEAHELMLRCYFSAKYSNTQDWSNLSFLQSATTSIGKGIFLHHLSS